MRAKLREGWVGSEYDIRHVDSELLDIFFTVDEEGAHDVCGSVEEPILDSAAVLLRQVRKESKCDS
jgi:hypothetical protein